MKDLQLNDVHNMMYSEFTQLNAVERLLNDEGRDTLKALWDLMQICCFYDDLKDYALDKRVNLLLVKYQHCRKIQTYAWMLSNVVKGGAAE